MPLASPFVSRPCVSLLHFQPRRPACLSASSQQSFASTSAAPAAKRQCNTAAAGGPFGRVDGAFGPPLPPKPEPAQQQQQYSQEVEDWVQDLIDDAPYDEEVAELLEGTDYDPEKIRAKMRESMTNKHKAIYASTRLGSDTPMRVRFREVDPTNLWLWFHLYSQPSEKEKQALEEVLRAWFMIGRLGGFNGMNLQVFHYGEDDASYFDYNGDEADDTLEAFMHEMGPVETRGEWARVWVDLGSSDELAMDVLINSLMTLSREHLGIKNLLVGGENEEWPTPKRNFMEGGADPMKAAMEMLRSGKK